MFDVKFTKETQMYEDNRMKQHVLNTFLWMIVGLGVTTITASCLYMSDLIFVLLTKIPMFSVIILIAQIGVAIGFTGLLHKMKPITAKFLFLIYAMILGVTMSTIAFIYNMESILFAFGIAVIFFGSLVAIGFTTKMNLLKYSSVLMIGLLVLIVVEVVMMFMGMDPNSQLICMIGLALFVFITIYDVQKMKALYYQYEYDEDMLSKMSIYSAFDFYLDFINIFLYILRLIGNND